MGDPLLLILLEKILILMTVLQMWMQTRNQLFQLLINVLVLGLMMTMSFMVLHINMIQKLLDLSPVLTQMIQRRDKADTMLVGVTCLLFLGRFLLPGTLQQELIMVNVLWDVLDLMILRTGHTETWGAQFMPAMPCNVADRPTRIWLTLLTSLPLTSNTGLSSSLRLGILWPPMDILS